MKIEPVLLFTSTEVRHLGQAAATRDEGLDTANVFPIGTNHHAVFTTAYLSQFSLLNEAGHELQLFLSLECDPKSIATL